MNELAGRAAEGKKILRPKVGALLTHQTMILPQSCPPFPSLALWKLVDGTASGSRISKCLASRSSAEMTRLGICEKLGIKKCNPQGIGMQKALAQ